MSERSDSLTIPIDEYQASVVSSRRVNFDRDWQDKFYGLIHGEYLELIGQHGPTLTLLLKDVDRAEILAEYPEILDGAKEEIGDLIWFGVSAADYVGADAKTLCSEALEVHTHRKNITPETFADLEDLVAVNAHKIKVLTKFGLLHPKLPTHPRSVSLFENPMYLLNRTVFRLTRSLSKGSRDVAPYTASQMEPISDLRLALGNYLNTLVYIARRLNLDIDEVVQANIQKVQQGT